MGWGGLFDHSVTPGPGPDLELDKVGWGGGVVVACLIIVSLQVLPLELLTMNVEYWG